MTWVVGGLLFLLLLGAFPAFRTIVGALAAIVLLVAAGSYFYLERKAEKEYNLIRLSEIYISDLYLHRPFSSYNLKGKVKNNSQYTVRSISLNILAFDCPLNYVSTQQCDTIGEDDVVANVDIPPNQLREIDSFVHFPNMPSIRNQFVWNFKLTGVPAKYN